jgi:hypothetical protein
MKRVLKYTIPVDDQAHAVAGRFWHPFGPVVHVACQDGPNSVQVWAETVTDDDLVTETTRDLKVYGTGQPVPLRAGHVGTAITASGALVWHVYDVTDVT